MKHLNKFLALLSMGLCLLLSSCTKEIEPQNGNILFVYPAGLYITLSDDLGKDLLKDRFDIGSIVAYNRDSQRPMRTELIVKDNQLKVTLDLPQVLSDRGVKWEEGQIFRTMTILRAHRNMLVLECEQKYHTLPAGFGGDASVQLVKVTCMGRSFEPSEGGSIVLPLRLVNGELGLLEK